MFRITLCRYSQITSSSRSFPAAIKQKSSNFRRRNHQDQFGLLGLGLAPQTERFERENLHDRFFKHEKVVKSEQAQFETSVSRRQLKAITLPSTISKERRLKLENKEYELQTYKKKYGMDQKDASLIIECKRSEYNHYEGQRYPSKEFPLVSENWGKSKYKDDWFAIKRTQKLPSAITDPEGREWEIFANILDAGIIKNIKHKLRFSHPTKIQFSTMEDWQLPMHLFIAGETGSGKTIAFGAPILSELLKQKQRGENPKVIILTVSSFLRNQTTKMLRDLVTDFKNPPIIFEGMKHSNLESMDDFDVLVATPSRASSLLKNLPQPLRISNVIFDEADMILDDSFVDAITEFLSIVSLRNSILDPKSNEGARAIFCSATCPNELQDLVEGIVDASSLAYIRSNRLHRLLPNIVQKFIRITHPERMEKLREVIEKELQTNDGRVLIFCKDIKRVQYVSEQLKESGVECFIIAKEKHKGGSIPSDVRVLIATDAGSRGLDLPLVTHVVNHDFPRHMVDYVHRIGRVGRCNASKRKNYVTSFVRSDLQISMVKEIERCARLNQPLKNIETDVAGMIKAHFEKRKNQETHPDKDAE